MTDERRPPPRRPVDLKDDEVVEIPPLGSSARLSPREPFSRLVKTPGETMSEVLAVQRKMALQLDGFGQGMNRRFDLFHEELALQRAEMSDARAAVDRLHTLVMADHAPRIDKVEETLGHKTARRGGIAAIVLVVAPMLAEAIPKYATLFEAIGGAFQ